jgi:PAS domain S-box-containing protein
MKNRNDRPGDTASSTDTTDSPQAGSGKALRLRAEEAYRKKTAGRAENVEALSPDEVRRMLHDLRVHQVELEMQNEELRRVQEELEAGRVRYFDLYDRAPVGYFTFSEQGLIMEANLAAATLLCVTKSGLVKQPLTRFILPDDQDIFYWHRKRLFETGAPQMCEIRMVKKEAAPLWVRMDAIVVQAAGGAPLCRTTMSNITELKQAEEALQRGENQYRLLVESINEAVVVLQDNKAKFMNRGVEWSGYSREEYMSIPIMETIHPEDREAVEKRYLKKISGDTTPTHHTYRGLDKSGRIHWIEVSSVLIDWEGQPATLNLITDITDRKQVEEKLKSKESLNYALFEYNPQQGIAVDLEGKVMAINRAKRISGDRLPNIGDVMYRDYASSHEMDMYSELMVCLSSEKLKVFPEQKYREKILSISIAPFSMGAVIVSEDITARKRAEEDLRVSREQMRALAGRLQAVREEERTKVAREIHDELGGALTGLKIDFSFLVRTALKIKSETVRTALLAGMDSMMKSVDATIQTVRRIAMELRPGVLDDLGLIAALEWQLNDFQKHTGIRCEWISSVEYIDLNADLSTALFRIFQEALTNVVRHSGATEVHACLRADADFCILEIKDNGKGIEKRKTLSSKSLGLLGMRERVLIFGGRIVVTGTPGTGTTVTVEMPIIEKRKMDREQEGAAG